MNDELIAKTPIGEIVVGIKSDHDYPGIFTVETYTASL